MAVRKRVLLPDITVQTVQGPMDIVSRQSIMEALADAVVFQEFAGGFVSSAVQREATGAPDEMLTVVAVVEWKDRADAKPQPERESAREMVRRVSAEAMQQELEDEAAVADQMGVDPALLEETPEPEHPVLPFDHPPVESPDGLDESLLEDEDVETPESVR